MPTSDAENQSKLLILVAGAKGAVASTLAVAVAQMQPHPEKVLASLTTTGRFNRLGRPATMLMGGWDTEKASWQELLAHQGVLPAEIYREVGQELDQIMIRPVPNKGLRVKDQVEQVIHDINAYKAQHPDSMPVFVNLLPACPSCSLGSLDSIDELMEQPINTNFPDLAYVLGAILTGVPVVNFTPNSLEIPLIIKEAEDRKVPISGRDGKTGQTYFKVVLASAFKARNLTVDGWYSLNILGNADGANLMNPRNAAGKVANKTELLDEILGYSVGASYGHPAHKVHIDYYPPRGDAKEAWDVIDIKGLLGLPMSLRLNLQGRDSILAAPLVLDLAIWMSIIQQANIFGLVPQLGFYFKKPVGEAAPLTFQEQLLALDKLEAACTRRILDPS
jgi:myo-inositol-1-phosphate synthase